MERADCLGRIAVCECCMYIHANGECGDHEHEHEPLSVIGDGLTITMGLLAEEHEDGCTEADREADRCDCEGPWFSWSSCEGCGSPLGGDRYAFTMWREPAPVPQGWDKV